MSGARQQRGASGLDYLKSLPLYPLPQHAISRLTFRLTRIRTPWFKNLLIRAFAAHFGVDWSEALYQRPQDYVHFNDFFTRPLRNGARLIDARCRFHMYATGITPAMVTPKVGSGSQYVAGMRDSKGRRLEGSKTYKVHLPPNVPANQFWAFTVYDVQTRSMLQTDQRFPEITSADAGVKQNADSSYDVFFGPEAPAGKEGNWLHTISGKSWWLG